jgi:hypothetical protein
MGKIDYFNILLDKKDQIYYNGEMVTGKIQINVVERIKINSLFVEFDGESNVHW